MAVGGVQHFYVVARCREPRKWFRMAKRPKGVEDEEQAERRRRALRQFMEERGLIPAQWAKRAGKPGLANAISNFLNGGSRSLNQATLEALARPFGVSITSITGEGYRPVAGVITTLYVRGVVQAGAWREAAEWPRDEWEALSLPMGDSPYRAPYALRVAGSSMNQLYRDGDVLVCISLYDLGRDLRSGDKVIVHRRTRDGLIEATCKEYRIVDDKAWLWPRSDDPAHQAPLLVPNGAGDEHDQDADIEIVGIVIKSVRDEI